MTRAAIVDIDGTLVDTNYLHALAWQRALRHHDVTVEAWRIHRRIGMGGDQLVEAVAGEEVERRSGVALREREGELYAELIDEAMPLPGARELLVALGRDPEVTVVLASSAKSAEVERYLDLLDARELVDDWTTSSDVDATKPEPDLLHVALDKAGSTDDAVMIGDSIWDCEAARRAGIPSVGVLTGGFSRGELLDAGASHVYESAAELLDRLADSPLGNAERAA